MCWATTARAGGAVQSRLGAEEMRFLPQPDRQRVERVPIVYMFFYVRGTQKSRYCLVYYNFSQISFCNVSKQKWRTF